MPPSRLPTIIVFAREPLPGRTKTRLIARLGAAGAAALADAFVRDALAKARRIRSGGIVIAGAAPRGAKQSTYFRALERRYRVGLADQGSGTLGARMRRALRPYAEGGAVLFGTDTPSLPARLLARSVAMLRASPLVLGPSLDGGYYLVGVRGAMPDIFGGIEWGTGNVLSRTIARLERHGDRLSLGPSWYNVDRPDDLALLAVHLDRSAKARQACPATVRVMRKLGVLGPGR